MLRNKYLSASLLAAFVSAGIWGCAQAPTDMTIRQKVADNPVTVFGKVIDAQTRQGIGNATVYIKVNGNWQSTTTSTATTVNGATGGSGDSVTGDFTFAGLPVATAVPVIVQSPTGSGYLQVTGNFTTSSYSANSAGVNSQISQDLGQTTMEKGIVATVYVVDANTGSYVTSTAPIPIYLGMGGNGSVEDVMATRDTTDTNKYTITIPQTGSSTLTVPALDANADGTYDYQSKSVTIASSGGVVSGAGDLTTTIALAPITNATAVAVAASNIKTAGANSGGTTMNFIGKSDPIKLLFNMPVSSTTDTVTMTYSDSFKSLTAAAVTAEVTVTAALSSGNTLLTVTPAAALTEGHSYTLNGTFTSKTSAAADSVYTLNAVATVTQTGTGTIGSTPTVTVDNFNYWTNGAVITPLTLTGTVTTNATTTVTGTGTAFLTELAVGDLVTIGTDVTVYTVATIPTATSFTTTVAVPLQTAVTVSAKPAQANAQAFLVFPEPVWGTVRLISTTSGPTATATTTISNGAPVAITGQAVSYYVKAAKGDTTTSSNTKGGNMATGPIFRYSLAAAGVGLVADNNATTTQSYMLGIDAYDADGNTMRTEASYAVQ